MQDINTLLYQLDGVTPYEPAGTTETKYKEENKNNSGN